VTTREEFMARIRAEMGKTRGLFPATPATRPEYPREEAEAIRAQLAERWPEALERFRHEFEKVGGVFHRVPTLTEVPEVVTGIARAREARRLVSWHPSQLGADLGQALAARGLTPLPMPPGEATNPTERARLRQLAASAELGLTGVDLAIAETGTLVLRSGAGRPRSTSLLPAYHIAVFDRTALVESLAQVGVFLELWHTDGATEDRGAVISFITGPSRTADIELTLTRGVHGPKEVHVIFVEREIRG